MKKFLLGSLTVIVVLAAAAFVFREPLMDALKERITADMFVSADTDAYDPGVAIGEPLPSLRALYDGAEITDVRRFAGANGTALVVNRSVDW
jgi:hypothetical protein